MKYTDSQNTEKSFRSLTGLSHEQFKALLPYFEGAHNEYLTHYAMDGNFRNEQQ